MTARHTDPVAELDIIRALERRLGRRGGRVLTPIGDDAAVVRAEPVAVLSLDTVVEGVHFRRATHSPADVGHKALAHALSDVAAMGATPGEALVGLIVPDDFYEDDAAALMAAAEGLAAECEATIAGGDVSSGPALAVTVAVTGWARAPEELVTRGGARPGDVVGVTGALGGSEAGRRLLDGLPAGLPAGVVDRLVARHRRPRPRLTAGRALAGAGASAMIDLSDGVATDARHLAERSGTLLRVELERLPQDAGVAEVAAAGGEDPHALAAAGGEDFELLFCAAPAACAACERAAEAAGTAVTWIGEVLAVQGAATFDVGVELVDARGAPVELRGYEHRVGGGVPQRRSVEGVPPSEPGPA